MFAKMFRKSPQYPLKAILEGFTQQVNDLNAFIDMRVADLDKNRAEIQRLNAEVTDCHCDISRADRIKANIGALIEEPNG